MKRNYRLVNESSNFDSNVYKETYIAKNVDITSIAEHLNGNPKYAIRKDSMFFTSNSNNGNNTKNRFNIISIYRGKSENKFEVGIAYMDLRVCTLNLCQFIDTPTFEILKVRLSMLDPIEILLCDAMEDTGSQVDAIIEIAKSVCSDIEILSIQRRFFDDERGINLIRVLASPEASNIDEIAMKKYLSISASYCLVRYIEQIQNISYASESLQVLYECLKDRCIIDLQTCRNLDLVKNLKEKNPSNKNLLLYKTLFSILNTCLTDGGTRTLKSNLLQPSCDLNIITKRQNVIEELKSNENLLHRIRNHLVHVQNMEFVIALCVHIEKKTEKSATRRKIQELINLRKTLNQVISMRNLVIPIKCDIISDLARTLYDKRLDEILDLITDKIDIDFEDKRNINQYLQKNFILYAVKSDSNILQASRKSFEEFIFSGERLAEEEIGNIPNCRLVYTPTRGFYYTVQTNGIPNNVDIPSNFINVCHNKTSITFTSRELLKVKERIDCCVSEILIVSNTIVDEILLNIRKLVPVLYKLTEFISYLDFICALSYYSSSTNTVKPTFSNCLIVEKGRHPLLEKHKKMIPNDVYIAPESCFMLITGPNMSGKTTYMKQVCLLQILAQTGCMIPADSATFPLFERIFSRLSHNDDITTNLSAFDMEMSEIGPILRNANEKSLIAIDELGRSTSTEEGLAICYAIIENLITTGAFTIFATHFLNLSKMTLSFSSIENYHFPSEEITSNNASNYNTYHTIKKGQYEGPLFGFKLAGACGFPDVVIENAKKLAEGIRNEDLNKYRTDGIVLYKRRLVKLGYKLFKCISIANKHDPSNVADHLRTLKNEYLKERY